MCLALALLVAPAAAAQSEGAMTFTGSLDDRSLTSIDANSPHELDPEQGTVVSVDVRNDTADTLEVRNVRLSARVLGLAFLNYTTRVDLVVEPGDTGTRTFALDLGDLGGQARGLLPATLELLDPDREVLATQDVPVDVQGGLGSVYGVFGLGIGAITALLFLSLLVRLAAGRMPMNRWSRAWRFAIPGVGLGLTMSLTLSVLRIMLPSPTASLGLVVVGVLVGLAIGYLTPGPDDGTGREDLYDEDFATTPAGPAAREDVEGVGRLRFSPTGHDTGAAPPEQPGPPALETGPAAPSRSPGEPGDPGRARPTL